MWITYRADIPQGEIDTLAGYATSRNKLIVSQQPLQDAPIVATAWGFQYEAQTADEEGLLQFIVELENSPDGPEPGGTCNGGVATMVG